MTEAEFRARVSSPRPAPYNTGRVRIGLAYVPRQRWTPSADAYRLQTALINVGKPKPSLLQRILWSLK